MKDDQPNVKAVLEELTLRACRLGASDAKFIATRDISVEDDLAKMCQKPGCEYYGLSASCPPYVSGPAGFRKLLKNYKQALVFKIDVPTEILFSHERRDIFQLLHQIAAEIEMSAVQMGFPDSKAFAGGSCKKLFCQEYPNCQVLTDAGECRNPRRARPSMSGFGINVSKLMQTAGWQMDRITGETDPEMASMGTLSGLLLIC